METKSYTFLLLFHSPKITTNKKSPQIQKIAHFFSTTIAYLKENYHIIHLNMRPLINNFLDKSMN